MSYSQGIARFADLFVSGAAQGPDAATFLAPLCPPGSSVLDIGAGAGGTTFALASRGVHVVALEPDPEMYTVLLSRLALRPELHEFAAPLPQPAGFAIPQTFDVVCSFAVIHLLQPAGGGWWYTHWKFTTLLAGDPVDEVQRTFRWYPLTHAEATDLLAEAGVVPNEEYGGYDRSAYVPDESRVRLIVAHVP